MPVGGFNVRQIVGLILGPLLFVLMLFLPLPEGMGAFGMKVAAVTLLMAVFWITEAVPIPATALFPIALFPLLGVMPTAQVTAAYANHLIFLFMGGFLIATAIERWKLHKRIALHTVRLVGTSPNQVILGFMLATAFLSCWISNTATAMLMATIGMAVLKQLQGDEPKCDNFSTALMLGIAYAASIGGVATLIGTPPNAILAGIVQKQYGYTIGFAEWMLFAAPLAAVMLAAAWFYLTHIAFKNGVTLERDSKAVIQKQIAALGPMSYQERAVLVVFLLVVSAWLFRGFVDWLWLSMVTDSSIAILGALLLFIIPADLKKGQFLLDWQTAVRIPWDIMILFGGGFALANGFVSSGLTEWMGNQLSLLQEAPLWLIVVMLVLLVKFLTEVTSNTATASLLLPVMTGFSLATDVPVLVLMGAVALSASLAFMLPVATPPNAIVFATRQVSIPQMAWSGLWLNLLASLLITLFVLLLLPHILSLPT